MTRAPGGAECVTMLVHKRLNGQWRPAPDRCDEVIGAGEHVVGMVDGDLAQMLHQELAARSTRDAIGLGIERTSVIARWPSDSGGSHYLCPLLDRHRLVGDLSPHVYAIPICPFAALGSELARSGDEVKAAAGAVLEELFVLFSNDDSAPAVRAEAIVALCTLVGAMTLSRVTANTRLSDEILKQVTNHLHELTQ